MIVINLNSQLGNQMFQYALYRKLMCRGRNVKLDLRYYKERPDHYALDLFHLPLKFAGDREIAVSKDEYRSIFSRIRRKFFGKRNCIINEVDTNTMIFNPDVFNLKKGYLYGYWQSEKYFADIRPVLLDDFRFPEVTGLQNIQLLDKIDSTVSVSIHIRRGDYIGGFPLMTSQYYAEAIDYFMKKYVDVFFVVFSNDVDWAKENIRFHDGVFVDWNTGSASYMDMYLMTRCNHNIIANSSFSWWGAWLNQNSEKEVIAPDVWFYHRKTPDIYCENWIVLPVKE